MMCASESCLTDQLQKTVLTPGDGLHTPTEGCQCTVTVTNTVSPSCQCDCHQCSRDNQHTLTLTLGNYYTLCQQALHIAVASMKQGETAHIVIQQQQQQQHTKNDLQEGNIREPKNSCICTGAFEADIKLLSLTESREVWELSPREILTRATELKSQGNTLYQTGKTYLSFAKYSRALKYLLCLDLVTDLPEDLGASIQSLKCLCYLNLSACQLQSSNYTAVVNNCTEALTVDSTCVKGLYRRSMAYTHLGCSELAQQDLKEAARIEPSNKAVERALTKTSDALKKQDSKMAAAMSKLFH